MTCPRCEGELGEHPARSRMSVEREERICADCGLDEAVRESSELAPIPPNEWPVRRSA
ncbi:hypothetical protein [Actinomadura atramentaria]|uniref:hypothetical protein n=1 Tax=Actinomadura atramentaria TaxID=1990 RepID=UPI00037F2609|nr:hypothetical protein [Actinomadura atramentaria]